MRIFYDSTQIRRSRMMKSRKRDEVTFMNLEDSKQDRQRGLSMLVPLVHTALIAVLLFALEIVFIKIFLSGPKLKWLFVPTVFLYFGVVSAVAYWFGTRVDRLKERELMGDEWFFRQYPLERWLNRWNKWYRRWSLRQTELLREKRMLNERGRYWRPVGGTSAEPPRGPELDARGRRRVRTETKHRPESEKRRQRLEAKHAKELAKYAPDLPESGFESWCETNADQRQIIR